MFKKIGFIIIALALVSVIAYGNDSRININTASESELMELPGIGKGTAKKILAYRTENDRFKSVDELIMVNGVGRKKYEKVRELITIGDANKEDILQESEKVTD